MSECVHIMDSYMNLIVCCISITWLVIEKNISQRNWHCVCYLVSQCVCDVVCACRASFMHMKEGASGRRKTVLLFYVCIYILRRKGLAGAGRCEDRV